MNPVYAVLLAGGQSKRCHPHKLFLPWNGKTVLEHSLDNLIQSQAVQTVVVLFHLAERASALLDDKPCYRTLGAPYFDRSLCTGIHYWLAYPSLETDAGFMVACADMPLVTPEFINTLIKAYRNTFADVIVPVYRNLHGFPRIFRKDYAMEIIRQGPREYHRFLMFPEKGVMEVEIETDTILTNINTLDDYYVSLFL